MDRVSVAEAARLTGLPALKIGEMVKRGELVAGKDAPGGKNGIPLESLRGIGRFNPPGPPPIEPSDTPVEVWSLDPVLRHHLVSLNEAGRAIRISALMRMHPDMKEYLEREPLPPVFRKRPPETRRPQRETVAPVHPPARPPAPPPQPPRPPPAPPPPPAPGSIQVAGAGSIYALGAIAAGLVLLLLLSGLITRKSEPQVYAEAEPTPMVAPAPQLPPLPVVPPPPIVEQPPPASVYHGPSGRQPDGRVMWPCDHSQTYDKSAYIYDEGTCSLVPRSRFAADEAKAAIGRKSAPRSKIVANWYGQRHP